MQDKPSTNWAHVTHVGGIKMELQTTGFKLDQPGHSSHLGSELANADCSVSVSL